jgi:hypothetical protein
MQVRAAPIGSFAGVGIRFAVCSLPLSRGILRQRAILRLFPEFIHDHRS